LFRILQHWRLRGLNGLARVGIYSEESREKTSYFQQVEQRMNKVLRMPASGTPRASANADFCDAHKLPLLGNCTAASD
jgi:hypothetical protein